MYSFSYLGVVKIAKIRGGKRDITCQITKEESQ
jgi:hypothetical protein